MAKRERDDDDEPEWIFDDAENPWRIKNHEPDVIEMLLPSGHVTCIDAHRHGDVKMHAWWAYKSYCKGKHYHTYAKTDYLGDDGKRKSMLLHAFLNDQWDGMPRDHINHNGLDNRDANVRNGDNSVNARNRMLENGGVQKLNGEDCWVAHWTKSNGKRAGKRFRWFPGDA